MPIISSNFNDVGNAGQVPGTCFIETNDSLTTIQTAGYLNTLQKQGLPLSENLMALVSINKGAATSTVWMAMHFANENWSLVPSAIEPSLNAKYLVQQPNATLPNAQAMSALATGLVKNTTTTGVQSIAAANVDYQPALSGESLTAVTVATDDKILIQDTSDSNNLKTVTSQSVANLFAGVTSVSGTTNRITSTGGLTPVIDISSNYVATVPNGGTGLATMTTAYAPVISGTTSTGNLQVASTGLTTAGWVLTSNGAAAVPSFQAAPGGASVFSQVSVTVTPTEMKTILNTTGKLLIAAQGANKLIVVNSVIYEYTYNSVVYATGDVVYLAYDAGGGWFITVGIPAADFQQPASPTIQDLMKPQDAYTGNGVAINKGVYMYSNSNFTNGDSTVTVHVTYQVITTVNT